MLPGFLQLALQRVRLATSLGGLGGAPRFALPVSLKALQNLTTVDVTLVVYPVSLRTPQPQTQGRRPLLASAEISLTLRSEGVELAVANETENYPMCVQEILAGTHAHCERNA